MLLVCLICVGPEQKPQDRFSYDVANLSAQNMYHSYVSMYMNYSATEYITSFQTSHFYEQLVHVILLSSIILLVLEAYF